MPNYKEISIEDAEILYAVDKSLVLYRFAGWEWVHAPYSKLSTIVGSAKTPSQFHDTYTDWHTGYPSFHVEVE